MLFRPPVKRVGAWPQPLVQWFGTRPTTCRSTCNRILWNREPFQINAGVVVTMARGPMDMPYDPGSTTKTCVFGFNSQPRFHNIPCDHESRNRARMGWPAHSAWPHGHLQKTKGAPTKGACARFFQIQTKVGFFIKVLVIFN